MRAFVTDRVRPIRFALLADAERQAILAALELNSYLWGGTLNPIVPISTPVTELWRTNIFGSERSMGDFLAECMETFDPDAIVKKKPPLSEFVRTTVRESQPWHNVIVLTHDDMTHDLRSQPEAYRNALQFQDLSSAAIATQRRHLGLSPETGG